MSDEIPFNVIFRKVKLVALGPDHPVATWNTQQANLTTIRSAVNDFNSSYEELPGELFPDYSEASYAETNFTYVHPTRLCFYVSRLVLEDDNCIYGTVRFSLNSPAEIYNYHSLISALERSIQESSVYPGFGARCLVDHDEYGVHSFSIIGFDILSPEDTDSAAVFGLTPVELRKAADEDAAPVSTMDNLGLVPLSDKQLVEMLTLQDQINSHVRADWKGEDPFPYIEAVIDEGAESRNHFGWKWWKKQVPNIPQVKMELTDIWHFYMSEIILAYPDSVQDQINEIRYLSGASLDATGPGFLENINQIIGDATRGSYNLWAFNKCMQAIDMSWEELYRWYIGKNVLNFFRQDNGYKEGTYVKIWKGREDNEYLFDILDEMDPNTDNVQKFIYDALEATYHSAVSDPA